MKYLLIFVILFGFGCKSKQIIIDKSRPNQDFEIGKCYVSLKLKDEKPTNYSKIERPFILEVLPPEFEKYPIKLSDSSVVKLDAYRTNYIVEMRKSSFRYETRDELLHYYTYDRNHDGFMFCIIEEPAHYQTFSKQEIEDIERVIYLDRIKRQSKVVKKYVKKRPDKLKENQYYFEGGTYTEYREVMGGRHHYNRIIYQIKSKLNKLGYSRTVDDELDAQTLSNIRAFQKANGLKEGQLDFATIQKLEDGNPIILGVKSKLIFLKYDLKKDGILNEKTKAAIRDYQKKNGLKVGDLDNETLLRLDADSMI